jgi:hypothetical protein
LADSNGYGFDLGKPRGSEAAGTGNDLKAALGGRGPYKDGLQKAYGADAFGHLIEGFMVKRLARVGKGLGEL